MTDMKHVKIHVGGPGEGSVVVVLADGTEHDITSVVSAVDTTARSGQPTTATLTLPFVTAAFLAEAAHVPEATRDALIALGWSPPDAPAPAPLIDAPPLEGQ